MTELEKSLNKNDVSTEPAITVGATNTTVAGLLSLALYFFPDINNNTLRIILVLVAFGLPIVTALFTRGKVWSPASVRQVVDEAVKDALEQAEKNRKSESIRSLRAKATPITEDELRIRPATEI